MRRIFALTFVGLIAACAAQNDDVTAEDIDSVDLEPTALADAKADSSRTQADASELQLFYPETATLGGSAALQRYTFDGTKGWPVTFVLKSGAYRTYLRVTTPSGKRLGALGARAASGSTYESTLKVTLPETGSYSVVATATSNVWPSAAPRVKGEYTLSVDATIACAQTSGCPDYLKCLTDAAAPTCVKPDACVVPDDCSKLIHPFCAPGGWTCAAEGKGSVGTCAFHCGY
jgi:hypothetical protein